MNGRCGVCGPSGANKDTPGCCGNKPAAETKPGDAIAKLLGTEGPVHIHYHLSPPAAAPKEKKPSAPVPAPEQPASDAE